MRSRDRDSRDGVLRIIRAARKGFGGDVMSFIFHADGTDAAGNCCGKVVDGPCFDVAVNLGCGCGQNHAQMIILHAHCLMSEGAAVLERDGTLNTLLLLYLATHQSVAVTPFDFQRLYALARANRVTS